MSSWNDFFNVCANFIEKLPQNLPFVFQNPIDEMKFVLIPGGEETLEYVDEDGERKLCHLVVPSFYIALTLVSYGLFFKFYRVQRQSNLGKSRIRWVPSQENIESFQCPITGVTWEEATLYAQWAGGRLPTEEEWIWAALGPSNWKPIIPSLPSETYAKPVFMNIDTPVGISPWGVYQMGGNKLEWTSKSCSIDSKLSGTSLRYRICGGFHPVQYWRRQSEQGSVRSQDISFRYVLDIDYVKGKLNHELD